MIRTDPEQSLRRAVLAVEKAATTTSAGALRDALGAAIVRKLWSVPLPRASAVAFSPDGRLLAAGSTSGETPGRVGIWDVATGTLRASLCDRGVTVVRWTPDGKSLVLGLDDGSIAVWDDVRGGGTGVTPLVRAEDVEQVDDMDVRPDGRELAVAAGEKGLLRFELELGSTTAPARARLQGASRAGGEGRDHERRLQPGRRAARDRRLEGHRRARRHGERPGGVRDEAPQGRDPARGLQRTRARARRGQQLRPHRSQLAGRRTATPSPRATWAIARS